MTGAGHYFKRVRAKLSSVKGETLVETLVSTLIISGVVLMLCTAIVAAAKTNATLAVDETKLNIEGAAEIETGFAVYVQHKEQYGGNSVPQQVDAYSTSNGYVYYAPAS